MKKALVVLVLLGVVAGGAYGWFQQSIYRSLLELRDAVGRGDVKTVERYADLDAFAADAVDFGAAVGAAAAKDAAGDVGAQLVKGLASLFKGGVHGAVQPQMKDEIRATISEGRFPDVIGPFRPAQGYRALARIDAVSPTEKRVAITGMCEGEPAEAVVDFVRVPEGPFGVLGFWRAVGMSDDAIDALAAQCVAGAKRGRAARP
jgi:hypothetical protein